MDLTFAYVFRASNGTRVAVMRGTDPPVATAGGAVWTAKTRPGRKSLTVFTNTDPYKMDLPILFDGLQGDDSQEPAIALLNQMRQGDDFTEPPTINIDGGVPIKGGTWVIEDITWGTNQLWRAVNGHWYRVRQDAVVHLLQYVKETRLTIKKGTASVPRRYTFKKGDTLRKIAQKFYKDPNKWKQIAAANNIRDPSSIKPGKELKIP